jgi:hypothetical protein
LEVASETEEEEEAIVLATPRELSREEVTEFRNIINLVILKEDFTFLEVMVLRMFKVKQQQKQLLYNYCYIYILKLECLHLHRCSMQTGMCD